MAFDWTEFFRVAQELTEGDGIKDEAKVRTAVSRAYYGVYHFALAYCHDRGYEFEDASADHHRVRTYLTELHQSEASLFLYELHRHRKQADYRNPTDPQTVWLWHGAWSRAREIMDRLSAGDSKALN